MNLMQTIRAVAWSFVGIRKGSGLQDDMGKLNPLHVIAVALCGAALFVTALIVLVKWVVVK